MAPSINGVFNEVFNETTAYLSLASYIVREPVKKSTLTANLIQGPLYNKTKSFVNIDTKIFFFLLAENSLSFFIFSLSGAEILLCIQNEQQVRSII